MLIDQILNDPMLERAGLLSTTLRGRLSKATHFVLRQDFAMAADEFSSSVDNVNKVLPLARLPYPECWVEVAQNERRLFAEAPLDDGDGRCRRVGFLLTQLDQSSWSALMFWSFADLRLPPAVSPLLAVVDLGATDAVAAISFRPAEGVGSGPLQRVLHQVASKSDWVGEPGYLIATLALMHSRNASESVAVASKNKHRKLTGKPLLFDYHLVCIPQRYKQSHVASSGDDPAQLRAHFVRGHFKARKTGLFFWSAYQRGNPALGFAHKDYTLACGSVRL